MVATSTKLGFRLRLHKAVSSSVGITQVVLNTNETLFDHALHPSFSDVTMLGGGVSLGVISHTRAVPMEYVRQVTGSLPLTAAYVSGSSHSSC